MNKPMRTLALATVAVLALSGCIKMEVNLDLQSDDTIDGSMVFAVQEGLGEMLGDVEGEGGEVPSDEDAAREIFGEELDNDFANATEEPYNEGEWVGTRLTFEGEALDSFSEESDGFTITRDGDDFVVAGPYEASAAEDEEAEQLFEGAEMTMSITFPGEVSEHNGTLEGTTVTWNLLDAPDELSARGAASEGGDLPIFLLLGVLLAVIVIAGAITFVVVRARSKNSVTTNPDADHPEASAAPATAEPGDSAGPPQSTPPQQ